MDNTKAYADTANAFTAIVPVIVAIAANLLRTNLSLFDPFASSLPTDIVARTYIEMTGCNLPRAFP